jgi:hypothetical protein
LTVDGLFCSLTVLPFHDLATVPLTNFSLSDITVREGEVTL